MELKIKRRLESAILPKYMKEGDAGFDLSVVLKDEQIHGKEDNNSYFILKPGEKQLFDTGLTFDIPKGHEVQIRPRSGLACKYGVTVINAPGTIDESYIGPIMVGLINLSKDEFKIKEGERIAQAVLAPVVRAKIVEVDNIEKVTERGEGGIGHTGFDNNKFGIMILIDRKFVNKLDIKEAKQIVSSTGVDLNNNYTTVYLDIDPYSIDKYIIKVISDKPQKCLFPIKNNVFVEKVL